MKPPKIKKTTAEKQDDLLRQYLLQHYDPEILIADGFAKAFVCVAKAGKEYCCVYDSKKIISILRKRDKMSHDEAWEYFCFNILGAYVGERTPIFINPEEHQEVWPVTIHGRV